MKEVKITTEYIKLGQLLKYAAIIDSGALSKLFLNENEVLVNGIKEERRGRKLYPGDVVNVLNEEIVVKRDED